MRKLEVTPPTPTPPGTPASDAADVEGDLLGFLVSRESSTGQREEVVPLKPSEGHFYSALGKMKSHNGSDSKISTLEEFWFAGVSAERVKNIRETPL